MLLNLSPQTLLFIVAVIVAGALVLRLTYLRVRAEEDRLKLLHAQLAEQPLRQAVLQAQQAALQGRSESAAMLRPPAVDDPDWDSLLQYADQQ